MSELPPVFDEIRADWRQVCQTLGYLSETDETYYRKNRARVSALNMTDIITEVAEHHRISRAELVNVCRTDKHAKARWAAIYLIRGIVPNASFQMIGKQMNRDRTTVMHGMQQAVKLMKTDQEFATMVAAVRDRL